MSIIAAGTTTTTALSSTGNTDGTLQFQVNGTTPSVTLNALGAIGVGSSPNFGTSGQVLTSAGSTAAPTWTTIAASQWATSGSNISYTAGNVGIGTTAPAAKLTVEGTGNLTSGISVRRTNAVSFRLGMFVGDGTGGYVSDENYIASNNTNLRFLGGASGTTELMQLTLGGNLGIGTSSPGSRLDVRGSSPMLQVGQAGSSNGVSIQWENADGTARINTTGSAWPIIFQQNGTERARFDSSGKFIIGPSASSADRLLVNGPVQFGQSSDTNAYISFLGGNNYLSGSGTIRMNVGSGGVQLTSGATSWASASDERLKDIIEPITGAVEKVNTLRTVMGKYKTDAEGTRRPFLIAQDVIAVLPEAVDSVADTREGDETEYLSVRYTDTIPLLVAAIKEQQALITAQAEAITALTARVAALESN